MASTDHLHPQLFHGTRALLDIGDIIEPRRHVEEFGGKVAFATTDPHQASAYAHPTDKLFGAVYTVEPVDPDEEHLEPLREGNPVSRKGFRITGVHEYITRNPRYRK